MITEYPERSNHALPLRDPSLAQIGRDKRLKVEAFGTRDYLHPDRPLDSLEFHHVHYAQRRAPSPRAPSNRHADGSRKRKRESVDVQNLDLLTEIPQASDPYGTPISSETAPHGTDKPRQMMVDIPRETEVISIPDSPVNGQHTFDHRAPTVSDAHEPAKHSSPELPSTDPSLSRSREPSSHILPPKIIPPPPNQQHEIQQNATMGAPLQPQQASEGRLNVSQESAIGPSHQEPTINGVKKTPSPKLGDKATQLGRLRRPKSLKPPPGSGRSRKVINGVKQKTPSVFDPIESSEGSSYEHEQLRSAERLKAATESHQTPKSTHTQAEPDLLRARTHSHTPPEAFADTVPPKSYQEPTTTFQRKVHSATTAPGNGNGAYASACGTELETRPKQVAGQQANEKKHTDQSSKITAGAVSNQTVPTEQPSEGIDTAVQSSFQCSEYLPVPADSSQHVGHEKQDTEAKQKAQAEFDRLAAIRGDRTSSPRRRTSEPARAEENITGGQNACKEFEHPSFLALNNVNQPDLASMTLEERRQWNLKYVMPVHLAKLREYNDQALGVKKQEQAAQAEVRRREKQARAQEAKEARQAKMAAKKRAAEEQRAGQQQAKTEAEKAATEGRQPAEDQSQATEHRTEGLKARVGQRRQTQQAEAEKSKPTDFLQPTRMKTNPLAQPKEPSAKQVAKGVAEKAKQAAEAGLSSLVPGQAMSGNDANQVIESAPEQGVCNSNYQTWLLNRSPKAIHSAERQLQLANEWLKQTKRKSMVVQVPRVTAKATSSAPAPNKQQAQQNSQRPAKQVQKQRNEDYMGAQRLVSTTGPFMDDDALMAAGLTARLPVTSAPRQRLTSGLGTTDKATHTTNAETKRVVPSKPQLHGILKAAESKSSSPAVEKSHAVRVRSMTPAIPSSSNSSIRGYAVSAEAQAVALRRAATVAPEALKTPVRNAFRAARSVSFADDALPSSQPPDVNTNSTTQSSGARKGMLYRALEESNAKRAEEASEREKSTSARTTADLNKVTKPQTKAKQTKMTQHISHDIKQKGKAVDRPPARQHLLEKPLSYASLSEASTYFSDESDGQRMGKAGPSSRKRAKSILKASTVGPTLSDKRWTIPPRPVALSTSRPARNPVSRVRRRARSTHLVPSNKSITISSSSSSSYSDSEVEKVFGQTDDVALLPLRNPSQQSLGASSRAESQRRATVTKTSSQVDPRSSLVPEPSSTLKQPTNDFKASQRSEEWRLSQEADRQLQREHMEALRQERMTEAPPTKQNGTPVSSQRTPVQRPLRHIEPKTGKSGGKATVSAGFDTSSLSKLRKAQTASQAASQPAVGSKKTVPRRDQVQAPLTVELANGIDSGSDSSSSDTDEVDPGQLVRQKSDPPKKRNPFSKVFAELWPRK